MKTDREYTEVDGNVAYAVLPVSEEGIREGVRRAISGEYNLLVFKYNFFYCF